MGWKFSTGPHKSGEKKGATFLFCILHKCPDEISRTKTFTSHYLKVQRVIKKISILNFFFSTPLGQEQTVFSRKNIMF